MIDFVVIGAQKCGTTTLFRYLQEHPAIKVPGAKEVPFFSDDARWRRGMPEYFDELGWREDGRRAGTVTTSYMIDLRSVERIASACPSARIVAMVRDPIARAVSHYRMCVRRGLEHRTIDAALTAALSPETLEAARACTHEERNETIGYVAWGEYDRILARYEAVFPRDSIAVFDIADLQREPRLVLARVYAHIGVDPNFVPKNLGLTAHRGGTQRRTDLAERIFKNVAPLRSVWRMLPARTRGKWLYWYEQWNVRPESPDAVAAGMSRRTIDALSTHFAASNFALRRYGIEF
jgi:hypothetical protein